MALKEIFNFHQVASQNTAEIVINVANADIVPDIEQRLFDPLTLVITNATGGGGTVLLAGIDYTFGSLNDYATIKVGLDIYAAINIVNPIYFNVDLFIQIGTLNMYGDRVLDSDINSLQGQISALTGGYDLEMIHDLSAASVVWDLDAFFSQSDGYIESWEWFGGESTYQATFTGGVGKAIGGVAIASILTDLTGDGQGRLTLKKDGNNSRILYFNDADAGQFAAGEFSKTPDGKIVQDVQVSNVVDTPGFSGNLRTSLAFNVQLVLTQKTGGDFRMSTGNTNAILHWVLLLSNVYTDTIETPYYAYVSTAYRAAEQREVNIRALGRWTNTNPRIG